MSRKVKYNTMNTMVRSITIEVEDNASSEDIAKKANLYASLHGWDEIHDRGVAGVWVTEVPDDEQPVKNPIYR